MIEPTITRRTGSIEFHYGLMPAGEGDEIRALVIEHSYLAWDVPDEVTFTDTFIVIANLNILEGHPYKYTMTQKLMRSDRPNYPTIFSPAAISVEGLERQFGTIIRHHLHWLHRKPGLNLD